MEAVNQIIIDALHFISVIQDVLAKKRLFVETVSLQEYNNYVKEWKQEQKKVVKPLPKEIESVQVVKQLEGKQLNIEAEELAIVDALLEKARNLRMKNKELLKETSDYRNKSQIFVESSASKSSKSDLQHKMRIQKNTQDSNGDKKIIPRSKSTLISSTIKTAVVPRSKSANTYQVTKDADKVPKKSETVTKMNSAKIKHPSSKRNEQRTLDKCSSAVLSNKDLKDFKNLFSNQRDCDKKKDKLLCLENCDVRLSSDCLQFSNHPSSFPTYRKFQNDLKRTFMSKSCFQLHPSVIWYPYLSVRNRNHLCPVKPFDSFESFKKAIEILHKIQETMVWIDILNFIGKALAKLQLLDKNDENVVRVCSYLRSICRKDLQRPPVLDSC